MMLQLKHKLNISQIRTVKSDGSTVTFKTVSSKKLWMLRSTGLYPGHEDFLTLASDGEYYPEDAQIDFCTQSCVHENRVMRTTNQYL